MKSKRPRKLNYIVNQRRSIRGDKVRKATKHYEKLLRRKEIEGDTKWIANAMKFVEVKLAKYGVNTDNISS